MAVRYDWTETTLGEVATWGSGGTPKSGESAYYDGDIPWCVIGDLTESEVFLTEKYITSEGLKNSSAKIVEPGAVMVAMYGASIGRTGIVGRPMATNQAIAFAYPSAETLDNRFLLSFLQTQKLQFVEAGQGAAQPNISQTVLKAWPILLPPLEAQQRIVDVVSSVDAYIDALQQQADTARTTRNAVLHELLSAGGDDWTETTLGKTLDIARGGSPRPIKDFITSEEDGVNWVKIGDASASSKYIYRTEQKIRLEGISRSRQVKVGDFILSNSMSFGRPYIMRTDGCIHDGWLLLSKVEKYFDEDFLYNLLMSDLVQKQFDSLAAGSGVRNLNIEVAKEVVIPLPPLKVQREIAQVANGMDEFILAAEQAVLDAKNLRSGLLSDLLSGEHEIPASYDVFMGAA